jgi:glutathione peroxidase
VTFPVLGKIDVNGKNADPIFVFLKKSAPGIFGSKLIKWNFTKFLIDENGNLIAVFHNKVNPMSEEITKYLN